MTETERNKRRKEARVTGYMHGMAPAKNQGQRKVIPAHVGYLRAVPRRDVQNSSMLPHARFQHTPLFACGNIYPRTVRNGSLRCESVAEATSSVPSSKNASSEQSS